MDTSKILISSDDYRREKSAYLLDLTTLNYVVVENTDITLTSGYGNEIRSVRDKKDELVAFFAIGATCHFFCHGRIYDLTDPFLAGEVKSSFHRKFFTLRNKHATLAQFEYNYRDVETDLLVAIAHWLKDPLRDLHFAHMAEFFSTRDLADRCEVDRKNSLRLREARNSRRKGMNIFLKIKDICKYGI